MSQSSSSPDRVSSESVRDSSVTATILTEAAERLRDTDYSAFLVPPRIIRRVIKEDRDLPGLGFRIPHRKSYVIAGERLRRYVEPEELGVAGVQYVPDSVILISEPKESELDGMSGDDLSRWTWRLLFHARVHRALDKQYGAGELTNAEVRSRIDSIGQVEFDEARTVLDKEHFLFGRPELVDVYLEFAAVFLEFYYFSPWRLPWYFPSLTDVDRVKAIVEQGVDPGGLLEETRVGGLASPIEPPTCDSPETTEEAKSLAAGERQPDDEREATAAETIKPKKATRLIARAQKVDERGNTIRAAIFYRQAAANAESAQAEEALAASETALDQLVGRLATALDFSEDDAADWRGTLSILLDRSTRGFWNTDRRLLYDLQKVCLDHEREVFKIDLPEYVRSRGKRPIKRPLPNQREVLMVKHLHSALRRLHASSLSDAQREQLSDLLHSAVKAAERQMRAHLRPAIEKALVDVGFQPTNAPERVAAAKLNEELLDVVAHRGYINMGILRDCISRNQLKLPDLSGMQELISGDRLLKADRRFSIALDGVYRRGDFYLRWLQRLSAVAFGTVAGRWITLFIAIPFGGAFVALEGIGHAVEKIGVPARHFTALPQILGVGVFVLAAIHWMAFRKAAGEVLSIFIRVLGSILIDMPTWAIRNPTIRRILRTRPVVLLRRFVVTPGLLTILFCYGLPLIGAYPRATLTTTVLVFLLIALAFNSRLGRNVEEITTDFLEHTWYQIKTRFFVALFESVMSAFRSLLELFDRFLYAIDEWLRFKSGESRVMFATKAAAGVVWAFVSFVIVFFVTLLLEPQINPIKHFPVVTVSHKIILPMGFPDGPLSKLIRPLASSDEAANAIAGSIVFLIPGIFGFLVWELRSNWRLYAANRPGRLRSANVGSHGETMIQLMKPGFHSGTLPKLFAKMRRAGRGNEDHTGSGVSAKYHQTLHHIEEAVGQFVTREFLGLLNETRCLGERQLRLARVTASSNNIQIDIRDKSSEETCRLVFQEQSGWLLAGIDELGWLRDLDEAERARVTAALSGMYTLGGVDLVRLQIERGVPVPMEHYDVDGRKLVIWPDASFESEFRYDLDSRPDLLPLGRRNAEKHGFVKIPAADIMFSAQAIAWSDWVAYWDNGSDAVARLNTTAGNEVLPVIAEKPTTDSDA